MKLPVLIAVLLWAAAGNALAQATYRCLDANGRSTYTNVAEEMATRKCTLVSREVSVVPAPARPAAPAAKGAPTRTSAAKSAPPPSTTASRANDRRRILQEELGDEEKRLGEAKQKLAEQQSVRSGDERNYQRVIDRLQPYVEAVALHEKNIAQLRRELGAGQ